MSEPTGRPARDANKGRVSTTLRIDRALLARVDQEAENREVGRNWLLCRLIGKGLDALAPIDQGATP